MYQHFVNDKGDWDTDLSIRKRIKKHGTKGEYELYRQNQEILSLLRKQNCLMEQLVELLKD